MPKTKMAVCVLAATLMSAPALAQTSTTPSPSTTAPAGPATSVNPNANVGSAPSNFIIRREAGMLRASELIGTDVIGANNEDIGEVGDVLIDRDGQVRAVIVDIGGFLGMGETHVAIPMQSVQLRPDRQSTDTTGSVGGAPGTTPGTTATTGTAGQTTAQTGAAGAGSNAGAPAVIVVMMNKEQLQNAPKFEDEQ